MWSFLVFLIFFVFLPKIINIMSGLQKNLQKYRVRVLMSGSGHEYWFYTDDFSQAVERFVFYVRACLELGLDARCVNIFSGRKCIKMFQNHA